MFFNDLRLITLLTDFGLQDVYVGVLKGAIAQVNPHLRVIDLTHQLPPQNIAAGSFCLMNAVPYFPPDTVHLAVVDPGVGSQRRPVAVQFPGGFLVGPDNGLFSGVLQETPAFAAVSLTNRQYWRISSPSATFHGRDIFAPVGAYLASGVPLEALGEAISPESLVMLPFPVVESTPKGIKGCIQYIDIFGNLVTNIPSRTVLGENWSVVVGKIKIPSGKTYSDVEPGEIIALIGSHGWVEIAVNGGNAQSQLQLNWGDVVLLT
jgi:S-adenosylmethionine hydrolase